MISQAITKEIFDYHESGNLIWKKTQYSNKLGKFAGGIDCAGYLKITILKKQYYAHRLIFFWHKGYFPKEIDHIDGNKLNNKIENLRETTSSQNKANIKIRKNNSSGYKGVTFHKRDKKWQSCIGSKYQIIYLGSFDNVIDAACRMSVGHTR